MKPTYLFLAAILFAFASQASALPGDLDPTFGGTGYVRTNIYQEPSVFPSNQLLIQPNGKILVETNTSAASTTAANITLVRLNADSTPDLSFGTNGVAVIAAGPFWSWKNSNNMALQPDGKIVVTVASSNFNQPDRCITTRVNSDGTPDTSFGGTGSVTTSIGTGCQPSAVKVQPDGKIVVAGRAVTLQDINHLYTWFIIRYNSDGSPDTGFGTSGISDANYNQNFLFVVNLLVQPDGKLLVCGDYQPPTGDRRFAAARFNAAGGVDTTFGISGLASIASEPLQVTATEAEEQPDGKVVFAGIVGNFLPQLFMLRMNTDGSLDPAFGSSGFVFFLDAPMSSFSATSVAFQADGKIIAGGSVILNVNGFYRGDFAVIRFNPNGSVDSASPALKNKMPGGKMRGLDLAQKENVLTDSFWGGSNGLITYGTPMGEEDITDIAVDAAGRVVVVGNSQVPILPNVVDSRLALARFLGDGSPYASIWGTVRSAGGLPIRNAYVTLSGGNLAQPVMVVTNNLGLYNFTGLPVTENYNVFVSAKRFRFTNNDETLMLNQEKGNLDFTANP